MYKIPRNILNEACKGCIHWKVYQTLVYVRGSPIHPYLHWHNEGNNAGVPFQKGQTTGHSVVWSSFVTLMVYQKWLKVIKEPILLDNNGQMTWVWTGASICPTTLLVWDSSSYTTAFRSTPWKLSLIPKGVGPPTYPMPSMSWMSLHDKIWDHTLASSQGPGQIRTAKSTMHTRVGQQNLLLPAPWDILLGKTTLWWPLSAQIEPQCAPC